MPLSLIRALDYGMESDRRGVIVWRPWRRAKVFVTSIISSQEWTRLRDAAHQAFPNEVLARGEIMRRFSLSGVAALKGRLGCGEEEVAA
jgi:hypothetical protein